MRVAILEDNSGRQSAMSRVLQERAVADEVVFFDNAPDMIGWLKDHLLEVGLICLDHDLGPARTRDGDVFDPGSGRDIVAFLLKCSPACAVVVHSSNPEAAPAMVWDLESAGWSVSRVIPYGDLEWVEASWAERITECLRVFGL